MIWMWLYQEIRYQSIQFRITLLYDDRFLFMREEEGLRLTHIVSRDQLKNRCLSQMHQLANSLRRSSNRNGISTFEPPQHYQTKMTEAGFGRKDLSLILKYLFYKQQMQLSDRNLLRRILISTFEEEAICAGSKKFIHFLRLFEGKGKLKCQPPNKLYFLLKGKGVVFSSDYKYKVQTGKIFGQIEMLSDQSIDYIQFESNYLVLTLNQSEFNLFYRAYFQNLYLKKQAQLQCINDPYLTRIPTWARYILLDKIQYRNFERGQKIIEAGEILKYIYFIGDEKIKTNNKKPQQLLPCLGLIQLLKDLRHYQKSFNCEHKIINVPCLRVEDFKSYVLEPLRLVSIQKPELDLRQSYLSLNTPDTPQQRPQLCSFMRRKKVKLSLGKSRVKTDLGQYSEIKFKFLKPQSMNSSLRYKRYTQKRIGNSVQKEGYLSLIPRKYK